MSDSVSLTVVGRRLEKFTAYRIEADLFYADDAFHLELPPPDFDIPEGARCELHINGRLELTGIIDRIEESTEKSGETLVLEGRDLMGLLVDHHVEEFPDLEGISLKALAERLLKPVPFISRQRVLIQSGLKAGTIATEKRHSRIEAGRTVFEILAEAARSRGALFYSLPDGSFVIGRPKAKGELLYQIVLQRDGVGNNVTSGRRIRDLSRRYSKITVLGQQQGADDISPADINVRAVVTDPQVPFYKSLVVVCNDDAATPAEQARLLLERQRAEGLQLIYRAPGHAQAGRNWAINELCQVRDERRQVNAPYLVYGRVFELDKERGQTTELRLGLPGVLL